MHGDPILDLVLLECVLILEYLSLEYQTHLVGGDPSLLHAGLLQIAHGAFSIDFDFELGARILPQGDLDLLLFHYD